MQYALHIKWTARFVLGASERCELFKSASGHIKDRWSSSSNHVVTLAFLFFAGEPFRVEIPLY